MKEMNKLKFNWRQLNFQNSIPKCWTILIYVLVLNSMVQQTQSRCCLEYDGKKCKACPEGTHLYRNNCILEIQNCQRHYGVTCLSCRQYYKLNNQKTRCLIPQNTTINLYGLIQLDLKEIQKPGINRIFQGIRTNLSNYRNVKLERIFYRPQNLQNPQLSVFPTEPVIYRVVFSFQSGVGEKIYRFIPAIPQRNIKEDLKQLYSSDNFTRINEKSVLREKGRKGIEEFYNQFNLSSVVWLTGADIIDVFKSIIPKEQNNKPYFSLNRVVFLPNVNSYVIASQLQTPVNFTVINERITLRSTGGFSTPKNQQSTPKSIPKPSPQSFILKPIDNRTPVQLNNKPEIASPNNSSSKNRGQNKVKPKSFKALNSIVPTKKPIPPSISLFQQINTETFMLTKIFQQINKKYLKKYFLSRINGQNLIKLASGDNQTHTIVQLVYKINEYKSQQYEYYTFCLNWQNYQIQLTKLFTVVSSSPLIVKTNNYREYNLLTQYKDQQSLNLIDKDISRMLRLIQNDNDYLEMIKIPDYVVNLVKLTVIEFVDFSNGNQQDNLTRFRRFTFKYYLELAQGSDKWRSYQFIQYRFEKVLEDSIVSMSNSQIYPLPKIFFIKQNFTEIRKSENFTESEIFRIRKNILTQLRYFSGGEDQVLLMSQSRSQVFRIYILNDKKLYKYQMYPPILGQPFLFFIESVQRSTRLLFQSDLLNKSKSEQVQKVQNFFNIKIPEDHEIQPKEEYLDPRPIAFQSLPVIKDQHYIKRSLKTIKNASHPLPQNNIYLRIDQRLQKPSQKQYKIIKNEI